jgi:GTP-binding protein
MGINHLLNTRYLMSETDQKRLPESLSEVTFVGRSNVGKSSLICALTGNNKLARVSKLPGRTRGINVFEVKKGQWLVDLPGYGYAVAPEKEREYWPTMIGGYITLRPQLATVYILIEADLGVRPQDISLLHWLDGLKVPCRIVGTKVDRIGRDRQLEKRKALANSLGLEADDIFWVSAKKGYGIKELRADILDALAAGRP